MTTEQLRLFPQQGRKGEYSPPVSRFGPLSADSSLSAGVSGFYEYMLRQGFADNTVKAFLGDLRLLQKHVGADTPLKKLSTKELNDFLTWLLHYRGVPCNAKSYSRRVTTLKVFFTFLKESDVLPSNPAAALIHRRVKTPLPQVLHDEQVDKLLAVTESLLDDAKPDARPHLLASLVLQTSIKKSECMGIGLSDVDRSNERAPSVVIRYTNPRMSHKERRISFSGDLLPVLDQYMEQYKPSEYIFECTARNLEYVLRDVSERAGLDSISFEILRWTGAMRDYRDGMEPDRLRKKLGLSPVTWREVENKLKKLIEAL